MASPVWFTYSEDVITTLVAMIALQSGDAVLLRRTWPTDTVEKYEMSTQMTQVTDVPAMGQKMTLTMDMKSAFSLANAERVGSGFRVAMPTKILKYDFKMDPEVPGGGMPSAADMPEVEVFITGDILNRIQGQAAMSGANSPMGLNSLMSARTTWGVLYPRFPSTPVRAGASWTVAEVDGVRADPNDTVTYTLSAFREEGGRRLADIKIKAHFAPDLKKIFSDMAGQQATPMPEMEGSFTMEIEGSVTVDVATGATVSAENQSTQEMKVSMAGQDIASSGTGKTSLKQVN